MTSTFFLLSNITFLTAPSSRGPAPFGPRTPAPSLVPKPPLVPSPPTSFVTSSPANDGSLASSNGFVSFEPSEVFWLAVVVVVTSAVRTVEVGGEVFRDVGPGLVGLARRVVEVFAFVGVGPVFLGLLVRCLVGLVRWCVVDGLRLLGVPVGPCLVGLGRGVVCGLRGVVCGSGLVLVVVWRTPSGTLGVCTGGLVGVCWCVVRGGGGGGGGGVVVGGGFVTGGA